MNNAVLKRLIDIIESMANDIERLDREINKLKQIDSNTNTSIEDKIKELQELGS